MKREQLNIRRNPKLNELLIELDQLGFNQTDSVNGGIKAFHQIAKENPERAAALVMLA